MNFFLKFYTCGIAVCLFGFVVFVLLLKRELNRGGELSSKIAKYLDVIFDDTLLPFWLYPFIPVINYIVGSGLIFIFFNKKLLREFFTFIDEEDNK